MGDKVRLGWNDHVDWEVPAAIKNLLDKGLIRAGTEEFMVAQHVIQRGYGSLSLVQRLVYDRGLIPLLIEHEEERP